MVWPANFLPKMWQENAEMAGCEGGKVKRSFIILALLFGVSSAATLVGCTPVAQPQPVVETKLTPVCEYGGQISGATFVCNPRFTPMPSPNMWSVGKVFFDNKTAQTCWGGPEFGNRGQADVNLPTCNSLSKDGK